MVIVSAILVVTLVVILGFVSKGNVGGILRFLRVILGAFLWAIPRAILRAMLGGGS